MDGLLRVLLVEDSKNDAMLVTRELKHGGFDPQVTRVQTEDEMRAAINDRAYDIILSDWHLPNFSGLEAFSLTRELAVEVPFIIVSGVVGEETAIQAMQAGVQDYVMKDNLKRLVPAIQRELVDAEVRRQRREAQQALLQTEERFTMFMQHLPGPATVKDSKGRYVFVNEYFRQMFPGRHVLGATIQDLLPKDMADFYTNADRQAFKERQPVESTNTLEVNGRTVTYLTIRFPIPQPDIEPLLGVIGVDITERKEAEDQLRALTRQLQQRTTELEKKNIALSEILGNIEAEKNAIKQRISNNIEQRILPTLRRLLDNAPPSMATTVQVLHKELLDVSSPFIQAIQQKAANLTARELEVCRMIKHGLTTKEIAESLNLSPATVQKHREVIRRKLGISGEDVNLHTFLQSL